MNEINSQHIKLRLRIIRIMCRNEGKPFVSYFYDFSLQTIGLYLYSKRKYYLRLIPTRSRHSVVFVKNIIKKKQ